MTHYKMDANKLQRLRDALGEEVIKKSLMKNFKIEKLRAMIPGAYRSLVATTRASVKKKGSLLGDRLKLCSSDGFGTIKFFALIIQEHENNASFIFLDATLMKQKGPFLVEFYTKFFDATRSLGAKPCHVVIVITSPVDSFVVMREITEHAQYVVFTTQYFAKSRPSSSAPSLYDETCYFVTYTFFQVGFEISFDQTEIMEEVLTSFKTLGRLKNYEEQEQDVLEQTLAGEKSKTFMIH